MKRLGPKRAFPSRDGDDHARPFSSRIYAARRDKRVSRTTMARVCGVTPGVVEAWERGDLVPDDPGAILGLLANPPRSQLLHPEDVDREWPSRLRDLRISKGLTQADVAEELEVSKPAVSQWESGAVHPRAERRAAVLHFVEQMPPSAMGRSRFGRPAGKAGRKL